MDQKQEIEIRILSIIRRRSNYYKYQSMIQSPFFELESNRQVFLLIDEYFQDPNNRVRKLTVSNLKLLVLRKIKNEDLRKECKVICSSLLKYRTMDNNVIEELVKDFAKRQLVKQGILAGLDELDKPNPDFSLIQEHIDKAILVGTSNSSSYYSYFEDPEGRVIEDKIYNRIVTGIPQLDTALDGGFGPGELVIVLAPPERGKTLTLVNFATAALHQGMTVGYLTHELSERKVGRRFDLRITGRTVEALRLDTTRIKNPLASLRKNGCDLIIKDYSAEAPHIEDIRAFVLNYQSRMKKKFDIIFVDYADLIMPTKSFKQERFGLKEIYTNLRRLANEFKIPFITASQANRKSVDNYMVTMKDFDECFAKAGIADVVLGLCQTQEELEEELCRMFIAKNRSSGSHKVLRLTMKTRTMFLGEFDRGENLKQNVKKSLADRI